MVDTHDDVSELLRQLQPTDQAEETGQPLQASATRQALAGHPATDILQKGIEAWIDHVRAKLRQRLRLLLVAPQD